MFETKKSGIKSFNVIDLYGLFGFSFFDSTTYGLTVDLYDCYITVVYYEGLCLGGLTTTLFSTCGSFCSYIYGFFVGGFDM